MDAWIRSLEPHYFWLIAGLLLGAAEIMIPGFFLIWFAGAAIITGLLAFLLPISFTAQIAIFALLSVAAVYAGRQWFRKNPIETTDPALNNRGARLAGQVVTVVDPIQHGTGRVKVGDSVWNARGPDAAAGAAVRITGADGNVLLVETVAS
jgi:inner membrane protein